MHERRGAYPEPARMMQIAEACDAINRLDAMIVLVTLGAVHIATLTTIVYLIRERKRDDVLPLQDAKNRGSPGIREHKTR